MLIIIVDWQLSLCLKKLVKLSLFSRFLSLIIQKKPARFVKKIVKIRSCLSGLKPSSTAGKLLMRIRN